jgi:hypothetical protein
LDARIRTMKARRDRYYARSVACRTALRDSLDVLGLRRLDDPEFTASLKAARPSVIVTDIDALPKEMLRVTVAPNKEAIGAALRAGTTVAGAELSNGGPAVLAISRA